MEETKIRAYARLMEELDLSKLAFTSEGESLCLERKGALLPLQAAAQPAAPAPIQTGLAEILSPMVGVFYRAPAENAASFVQEGDRVHKGDTLCIIEAMKLMNEITSDRDGVVAEICVENDQVVDYGRVLFRIREETP